MLSKGCLAGHFIFTTVLAQQIGGGGRQRDINIAQRLASLATLQPESSLLDSALGPCTVFALPYDLLCAGSKDQKQCWVCFFSILLLRAEVVWKRGKGMPSSR